MKQVLKSGLQALQINILLDGEDAARFLRYKEAQKIKAHAAAAYKLLAERLEQVEQEQEQAAMVAG
jgi:hypothetical protein